MSWWHSFTNYTDSAKVEVKMIADLYGLMVVTISIFFIGGIIGHMIEKEQ